MSRTGEAPSGPLFHEALDEVERGLGDLLPTAVDRDRVTTVRNLDVLRYRVLVLRLLLECRFGNRRRGLMVLFADEDQHGTAFRSFLVSLGLSRRIQIRERGLENRNS